MNILYIHQYFHTPKEPGSTRSYWIAQELLKNGHEVTIITTNPKGTKKREEKIIDDIKVIYLKQAYNQSMSIFQRLKSFLSFVWKSTIEAKKHKKTDLVIATSTPLTVGITALYLKKYKQIPYVFEVRDLWPEVPIQMGAIKNPFIKSATRWFEKKIYINAEHVIALSPGMRDGVLKYLPKEKTSMIPNMSKVDKFWPRERNNDLIKELGLKKDTFKIIHFGALGLANGAQMIIESARLLNEDKTIEFLFLGGGSQEAKLKSLCEKYKLKNVLFLGNYPMKELSEIVNLSDVSMISFLDLPILYTNSPNKLFDSLSAGKPIIVNSAGWTKKMVEEGNCGFYVNPNIPTELAELILDLKEKPQLIDEMGCNSRKLAETVYDKSILCHQFAQVIEKTMR